MRHSGLDGEIHRVREEPQKHPGTLERHQRVAGGGNQRRIHDRQLFAQAGHVAGLENRIDVPLQHPHGWHRAAQIGHGCRPDGVGVAQQQQVRPHIERKASERAVGRAGAERAATKRRRGAGHLAIGEVHHRVAGADQAAG